MASLDIAALISPVSEASPCGDNLEYDPSFSNLEILATPRAEQQIGDAVAAGAEPEWQDVRKAAEAMFARTKDLRVAGHLTRAVLHLDGIGGLRDGLALIYALVERYWDEVQPRLDPEDGLDPTMRVNVINSLADPAAVINPLRRLPLVSSRLVGRFSLRDMLVARGDLEAAGNDAKVEISTIKAAFTDIGATAGQAVRAEIEDALNAAKAIEKVVSDKVGAASGPSLTPLTATLRDMAKIFDEYMPSAAPQAVAAPQGSTEAARDAGSGSAMASVPGEIRSREDVIQAIDRICEYYSRMEPASPLPFLLARARRLVFASFIDIMKDIAPDGLPQAQQILGASEESQLAQAAP